MTKKATDTFRTKPYLHNCSQAVAYKYKEILGLDEAQVLQRFAACGGGRCEGGMCGALYAAIAVRPDMADLITRRFMEKTKGFTTCLQIKQLSGVPCTDCVQAADDILDSIAGENK
ncbi:MAG: hypothetical protein II375_08870 [Bacteroidales bacterium]|nr:hypothetical protein [Bacteroidales bacterium]